MAAQFIRSSEKCLPEDDRIGSQAEPYVAMVNAAFSAELALKAALLFHHKRYKFGHHLTTLFRKLPERFREQVKNELGHNGFDQVLLESSTAFEEWRYAFANNVEVGYLGFLRSLARVILVELERTRSKQVGETLPAH